MKKVHLSRTYIAHYETEVESQCNSEQRGAPGNRPIIMLELTDEIPKVTCEKCRKIILAGIKAWLK